MRAFIEGIVSQLQEIFDPALLGEQAASFMANVIVALVVFATYYLVWRLVRWILRSTLEGGQVDQTVANFVMLIARYTILIIGGVNALNAAGVETSALLASLGIAGLTIGFAARDALSNLISGILIFIDRPFVIGDLVEVEHNYGRVEKITLRSTRVVTPDGKMLAIPNAEVINKTVTSYTNFPHIRLDIEVTVAVDEDLARVREILLGLVQEGQGYLQDPSPRVVVTELNDYNVALQLQAWLQDERSHMEQRFSLREEAFQALNKAGVEMPFETLQLMPLQMETLS